MLADNHKNPESSQHDNSEEIYRFKIKKKMIETKEKLVSGRRVCELAGLIPPESYQLAIVIHGKYNPVNPDDIVDLSTPGIEKFDYISRDQSEG